MGQIEKPLHLRRPRLADQPHSCVYFPLFSNPAEYIWQRPLIEYRYRVFTLPVGSLWGMALNECMRLIP